MSKLKAQLAGFQHFGTPFYLYQKDVLSNTLAACLSAAKPFNYHVHYALKANANPEILKMMIAQGFGADAVSGNEISAALKAGFSADKIAFAGVGKADWEIELGLASGIFSFNCESIQELEVIQEIATKMNCKANIALRLNPNINAKTHKYITTGLEENKFGINFWELDATLAKLETLDRLSLTGIHFHIGSQITDIEPYKQLAIRASEAVRYFEDRNIRLQHLNLGGGLGIDYQHPEENMHPDFEHYQLTELTTGEKRKLSEL
jgi:diaminopimelate decarboxylase